MIVVAVDGMGGDHGPETVVRGAVAALAADPALAIALVGDRAFLKAPVADALAADASLAARLRVHHADHSIPMSARAPVEAMRQHPRSSIAVGLGLCREGAAHAFFSTGHTGAVAVGAAIALRMLDGVRRPGIAAALPHLGGGTTVLVDVGANLAPRPADLAGYAVMGAVYARLLLGREEPIVGVLNIASEKGKGGAAIVEADARCKQLPGMRYRGFVEGHDLFRGEADVVVCDAFTGNAVLKVAEGLAPVLLDRIEHELVRSGALRADTEQARRVLVLVRERCDYATAGGAPLLGVDGVVLVGHGRSTAKAVSNGVLLAAKAARAGLRREMARGLAEAGPALGREEV